MGRSFVSSGWIAVVNVGSLWGKSRLLFGFVALQLLALSL